MINGDVNAKTGNLDDTITPDKFDEEFDLKLNKPPPKRNSRDKAINPRGTEMLDMCKSLDLNIINGRKSGDLFGDYTCIKWNGNSVIDYLLTSSALYSKISSFKVGEFLPWLSDHCPIHFTLKLDNEKQLKTQSNVPKTSAPKQFVWSSAGRQTFLDILKTEDFQAKLDNLKPEKKNF